MSYQFKHPICKKCGSLMKHIERTLNKEGTRYVHKYWCANGHNNRYAFIRGSPPPKYVIYGVHFDNVEEAYIYCLQWMEYWERRPRVWHCFQQRWIKYEELIEEC